MAAPQPAPRERRTHLILVSFALAVSIAVTFGDVCGHKFLLYDDHPYVTDNPQVMQGITGSGIVWALTTDHVSNWHPLTWISLQLDAQIFGVRAWAFHLTNLLFHIANTILLFLVLARMTDSLIRSAIVAALFGLHPLHVESVAWIAERKDVLSTFFWILTMGAYASYVEKPSWRRYLLVVLAHALGTMSKPTVVTLPFVLMLLDVWPLRRMGIISEVGRWRMPAWAALRPILLDKLPLLALSAFCSVATWLAQKKEGAMESLTTLPMEFRLGNAALAYWSYLRKTVWPVDLAALYPHAGTNLDLLAAVAAGLMLLAVTGVVLWYGARFPYLPVGWFWYLGTLVPMIGIVQVGVQSMADRYTYVPLIGVFLATVWGIGDIATRWSYQRSIVVLTVGLLFLFAVHTWCQVQVWESDETLWRHAVSVTDRNPRAHNNLGFALIQTGQYDEAIRVFHASLAINPNDPQAHNNLGWIYGVIGDSQAAEAEFREALRIDPNHEMARTNLNRMLEKSKLPNPTPGPR